MELNSKKFIHDCLIRRKNRFQYPEKNPCVFLNAEITQWRTLYEDACQINQDICDINGYLNYGPIYESCKA